MFNSYLKTAFRNLWKNKTSSIINVFGLAIGFACCTLITMYVFSELQADRFHQDSDRIFRVTTEYTSKGGGEGTLSTVGRALLNQIEENIPEAEYVIPIRRSGISVRANDQFFFDRVVYAGDHFFDVFTHHFLAGDPQTALTEPFTIVLTNSIAKKYFGNEQAIGKTITLDDSMACRVTGVIEDPLPSHMAFDVMISFATHTARGTPENIWFTWDTYCYVMLKPNTNPAAAEKKISALSMMNNREEYEGNGYEVSHALEPLRDIYLYSKAGGVYVTTGNIRQIYILLLVGMLMLLLACMNFINLTTAYYVERSKEVGIRKTIGAHRNAIIAQFYTEVFATIFVAQLLALGLVILLLPLFNSLIGKTLTLSMLLQPGIILSAALIVMVTGIIAGWYPSFFMSKVAPLKVLRGHFSGEIKTPVLRKILVVTQFCISSVLIISTLMVWRQLSYMQNQSLGFNKDQLLVINLTKTPTQNYDRKIESFRHQLAALPFVQSASAAGAFPGRYGWDGQLVWPEGRPEDKSLTMEVVITDYDYTKTLGLEMKTGRDFSRSYSTDATQGVLLNEKACEFIGWKPEEAIGKQVRTAGRDSGVVTGVIADFHQHGLQSEIRPTLYFIYPPAQAYLGVKLANIDYQGHLGKIKTIWSSAFAGYPFDYFFLDEDFHRQYKAESRLQNVFSLFSLLTILLACMGLFGLVAFAARKRTKEIGIRKVLGATVSGIVTLLSKDFLKLIFISIIIATPIAWYVMDKWLQGYAYRINVPWWIFVLTGVGVLFIAWLTLSAHAIKAAIANPVKSLRTE